jgi:hypothetical protein
MELQEQGTESRSHRMETERVQSAAEQLRQNAASLLREVRGEIEQIVAKLRELREEENHLARFLGETPMQQTNNGASHTESRTDWKAVLGTLPKKFKASDIRNIPQIGNRRSSEIYAGITRWMDAGLIKRAGRGDYVKVASANTSK